MWNFGSRIVLLLWRHVKYNLIQNTGFKEHNGMMVGKVPQINGELSEKTVSSSYYRNYETFIEASYN